MAGGELTHSERVGPGSLHAGLGLAAHRAAGYACVFRAEGA